MRNKFMLSVTALLCFFAQASAQVGIGTITPSASSSLEISSTTKGFLMPRMTSAQRTAIASPATGLLVYQIDAPVGIPSGFWYYDGDIWTRLAVTADVTIPSAFASNTTAAAITVVLGGTTVPLTTSLLSPGLTFDAATSTITASTAGRYRISYNIATTAALLMSTRVLVNGSPNTTSIDAPLVTVSNFSKEFVVDLNTTNNTFSLQAFGLLGLATLNNLSGGASLTVLKLK